MSVYDIPLLELRAMTAGQTGAVSA